MSETNSSTINSLAIRAGFVKPVKLEPGQVEIRFSNGESLILNHTELRQKTENGTLVNMNSLILNRVPKPKTD